jgi:hypothetical protein
MASGRVDSMADYLRKIMALLSEAKVVADADLPFLLQIEQEVVGKMREPVTQMQQAGIMPAGQSQIPGGGSPMQDMGQSAPPSMAGSMPMQSGGLSAGPGAPNPDELRRLLTQNQ